ncbi:hypothetical protein FTX61_15420 [Nitriliruptoraceae bacterium ZYF776]|nr:hypothetical protein [Profundirhabdus halotolerans]
MAFGACSNGVDEGISSRQDDVLARKVAVSQPLAYIPRTRELYGAHAPYRWARSETAPALVPLERNLAESTVMLVSSSGMFIGGDQEPFGLSDDSTIREIPAGVDQRLLWPSHFGYRTARAEDDPNTVFPLQRLHELASDGTIGAVADHAVSFMGGIYSHRRSRDQLAPAVIESARTTHVDLVLLVPV